MTACAGDKLGRRDMVSYGYRLQWARKTTGAEATFMGCAWILYLIGNLEKQDDGYMVPGRPPFDNVVV